MAVEIGLSDGTSIHIVDRSVADIIAQVDRMAHSSEQPSAPYGDWLVVGDGRYYNPAHVIYVKDAPEPAPFVEYVPAVTG